MSESNLGTAVLTLKVDTDLALAALNAFKAKVQGELGSADTSALFKGVEQDAKAAGEKAGRALAEGVKKTTKELKFGSFQQALDFTPKNTIKGLEDYARALRNLRDKTDLTVAGTQKLTDRLGAVEEALRAARQTTAQTAESQRRLEEALNKVAFQRYSESARSFSSALREQAKAAAANADQFRKLREQAEGAAKAVARVAAKGVGEALKVPIFGLPKDVTGTFDKARAQIERLQKQAETASGKVARLSEGVAVLGAGGLAAKGVIDVLGGIGDAASNTTGILSQVQQALASLPGPLKGLGGLDDIFSNGAQAVSNWAASILQAQGELSSLAAPLEAVTNSLGALGPEAVAVGGALAFTFAGFQDLIAKSFKPGVDGAREALKGITNDTQALLEALARVSNAAEGLASLRDLRAAEKDAIDRVQSSPAGSADNIQATQELLEVQRRIKNELQAQFVQEQRILLTEEQRARIGRQIQEAAKPSKTLALPSSEILNAEGRGIRRLTPDIGPAIDVGVQSARNFATQLLAAAEAGQQLPPIFGQVGISLEVLNNLADQQTQEYKRQSEELDEQISKQRRLRQLETERSAEARKKLAAEADRRRQGELAIAEFGAVDIRGRLPGGGFVPGSPGAVAARNARLREAGSNALIGGAFPALFGQGLGASVGGAVGGGAGGLVGGQFGFGLSLVGTALGTQFDEAINKLKTLGSALDDPIGQFSALSEAGLISSSSLEKQIQALIDTGREAEAAALIQKDLADNYRDLEGAKELAAASDELNRSWSRLQATTASLVGSQVVSLLTETTAALLTFAEAVKNLKDVIPEPIREQGGQFLKQFALGGLLPGIKTVQDVASFIPGSDKLPGFLGGLFGGGNNDQNNLEKQNQQLVAARENYGELNTLAFQLTAAQAQGNKELELTLRKRQIDLELQSKTALLNESNDPRGTQRQALVDKAKRDTFALDEQLRTLTNGSLTGLQNKLDQLNQQRLSVPVESTQFDELGLEIDSLKQKIENLQATPLSLGSFEGLQEQLSTLERKQIRLNVDSSAFNAANQRILETQNALDQLDGKKATITVEQINQGVQNGTLTNNFSNLERRAQAAQQALNNAPFGSDEFNRALRAAREANFELQQRREAANVNPEDPTQGLQKASDKVAQAFDQVVQASDAVVQAQKALRSAYEGAFDFLTPGLQNSLVAQAEADLRVAVNAGIFSQSALSGLDDKGLIAAANQFRNIQNAEANLTNANGRLIAAQENLTQATNALAGKDWNVNVAVNANTGASSVNLG